jgi:hypothetical protein
MRGSFKRRAFGGGSLFCGAGTCLLLGLILLATLPGFSAEGIFQGKVVNTPADEPVRPGWIFVQGGNHLLRRVEVAHAVIAFGQQVPLSQRRKCGPECLEVGQEIRVTAHQDVAGEWRASRVEILRLTTNVMQAVGPARPDGRKTAVQAVAGIMPSAIDFTKLNSQPSRAAG